MTRSWSSRCGATTYGSRAWSSNVSTVPMGCSRLCAPSARGRFADSACSSTMWSPAPRSHVWRREASQAGPGSVLVLGHPYVDVWQTVRPSALGIDAWPEVPRGTPWKEGVCVALGWPGETPADIRAAWIRIRSAVRSYADLEPTFLRAVEELVDFVTG